MTDNTFRILDCNDRAIEVLRAKDKAAILGRLASDIPSDHDIASEFPTYLRERLTAVRFFVIESNVVRDDGSRFMAETIIHQIDEGQILFKVRDVTARTENLHRLEEANERLRASYRARMEFVSNISHELRTPLTSMSYAITNMLRGSCGTLPDRAMDYLDRLQTDVRRLMTTINDILDSQQLENGTLTLQKRIIPLHRLLCEAADALHIQAEAKSQTLIVRPCVSEIYADADPNKIERVFFNIFSNAVKYTPEGGSITASIRKVDGRAIIQVDDTGIGIPPEALSRVSQRYFRVGDQVTGTGLGLSIVREITELHNGSFHITSPVPETTQGTRVTITLPSCEGPLAVIVSGDETFIQALHQQLLDLGHRVSVNREAVDLAKECEQLHPANFIFDGTLPESCLSELICQVRSTPTLTRTPILILTPTPERAQRVVFKQMQAQLRSYPISNADLKVCLR